MAQFMGSRGPVITDYIQPGDKTMLGNGTIMTVGNFLVF